MLDVDDTIVAITTPRAGGIRGIVRMTGPDSVRILAAVFQTATAWDVLCNGRPRMVPGLFAAGDLLGEIPCELYLWPNARSYTRQPAAELHTFGSLPLLDAVLSCLCRAGARMARPGEFTMRAFLAGRLDLTQAEAVLGVIDARSQVELKSALEQLAGGLASPLHSLREQLLELLAHLEAGLDFVEEDINFISTEQLVRQLQVASDSVGDLLSRLETRTDATGEPRVILRGLPNVGKSSLFNALAEREKSIVSEQPSTTRDYVSTPIEVAGRSVLLVDTAGVEQVPNSTSISGLAQRVSSNQAQRATLELFCVDSSRPLTEWEAEQISNANPSTESRIVVVTKCDQPRQIRLGVPSFDISSHTGTGIAELRRGIAARLDAILSDESAVMSSTAARCVESLRLADESLSRARELARDARGEELVAAELRIALDHLGIVTGVVYTDDILDRIFSRFCIGK
jgi:tRNA modification GTPase